MKRLVYMPTELAGETGEGLEIYVPGFEHDPTATDEHGTQVYIETFNGELRILVWDGSGEDPQHNIVIKPLKATVS